jgi:hypothetical protein
VATGSAPELAPPSVHAALNAAGNPLDPATRAAMESRFGHDFGKVRVHTDAVAARSAAAIDALAYTVGSDIVFGRDQYAPATGAGRRLLRHELSHVTQPAPARPAAPIPLGLPNSPEEARATRNETLARPDVAPVVAGAVALHRKGGTAGGFFANIGRGIADVFGSEPDYGQTDLDAYLDVLRTSDAIEDDFDSDNKARAIVRENRFQAESLRIRTLLVEEMLSGFVGDDDEQAILTILRQATPEERGRIAESAGYSDLYHAFDGAELDALYGLLPLLNSHHPRGAKEHSVSSMTDFIAKWETEHSRAMTPEERRTLAHGCIGITMLNLGTIHNPDLSNCYGSFQNAWDASRKMNEFLAANFPDRKAIIFSKRFWSGGKDYAPDPTTGKVDMSGYDYSPRPPEGGMGFTNFDYGFFDEKSGKWFHANHCDEPTLGSICRGAGAMEVYESNLQYYSRPLLDFDKQVFCVGISTLH